ncbi:unnamed protein product [Brassica rapa subsp. narinosa]
MSAAFLREPPHHFCLDYQPENHPPVHRTTPELFDSTPSSPRPPILPSTPTLGESQSGGLRSTNDLPSESFHRPPTRAQPTNPSQLHKTSDKHKK